MTERENRKEKREWFTGLALVFLLAVMAWGNSALSNRPPLATAQTSETGFSAERALGLIERVGGNRPHPVGTPAHRQVRANIVAELQALGLEPEIQSAFICGDYRRYCGEVHNIIALVPGASEELVALASHYDTVPATPGAADPMAGVATLLETARILAAREQPEHGVLLLFVDGEEAGLLGATAFVREHPYASRTRVLANFEARGRGGPSLVAYTANGNQALLGGLAAHNPDLAGDSALLALAGLLPNLTDQAIYAELNIPAVDFAFARDIRSYHSAIDTAGRLDPDSVQHHGTNALAFLDAFAYGALPKAGDDALFWNSGPLTIVLPLWVWLPVWLLAVAALGFGVLKARARGELTLRGLAVGLAFVPAYLALLMLGAMALDAAREAIEPYSSGYPAHPEPVLWALGFLGLALGLLLAWLSSCLIRPNTLTAGVMTGLALGAAGLGFALPGASYLLLMPLLFGAFGLALLPARFSGMLTAVLLALGAVAVWPAFLPNVFDLFGLQVMPFNGLLIGGALLAVFPLLVRLPWRRATGCVGLAASAASLVWGASQPVFTDRSPQWLSLTYVLPEDRTQARWISSGSPVPGAIQAVASFDSWSRIPEWYPRARGPFAEAPEIELELPVFEIVSSEPVDGGIRYTAHWSSPRNAPLARLVFPVVSGVRDIELAGVTVPESQAAEPMFGRGYDVVTLWTMPEAGITVRFTLDSEWQGRLILADRSYDLPAEGNALKDARPDSAAPNELGDGTLVVTEIAIPSP